MTISPIDSAKLATPTQRPDPAQQQKATLNTAILESTATQLQVKDEPLALVLRATIDGINEALEPALGANAIEAAVESGLDVSPEATADRIVSLSTAFFGAFIDQNPELDDDAALTQFLSTIGGGIDRGFSESREILEGLKVLEGEIATSIDRTFELVTAGLEAFEQRIQGIAEEVT